MKFNQIVINLSIHLLHDLMEFTTCHFIIKKSYYHDINNTI
jgi:hypothetical protein